MRAATVRERFPGQEQHHAVKALVAPAVSPPVFGGAGWYPAHRLPIGAAGRSPALEFLHFRLHEVMIWFVSGHGFSRAELEFLHFRLHEVMIWFVSGHGFSRAEP